MAKLIIRAGASSVEKDIAGENLLKTLIRMYPDGLGDATVFIGGSKVDLNEFDINRSFDADVVIVASPNGFDPISLIYIAVAVVVAVAASYLLAPEIPTTATGAKKSPNDEFSGQTNQIRLNELEPNIYGNVIAYPDIVTNEGGYWEYIDNRKIVRERFLIGSGSYQINSEPKFEQTPFSDIDGSTYAIYGENQETPVVYGQFNAEIVDGQGLPGPNNTDVEDGITVSDSDPLVNVIYDEVEGSISYVNVLESPQLDDLFDKYGQGVFLCDRIYRYWNVVAGSCVVGGNSDTNFISLFKNPLNTYTITFYEITPPINPCDPDDELNPSIKFYYSFDFTEKVGSTVIVNQPIATNELQLSFDFRQGLKGSCEIQVDISGSGASRMIENYTFSANTTSPRYFTRKIAHSYTDNIVVRVTRTNDDNDNGSDKCQLTQVASNSYRYNVNSGNKTFLTTERKATEQAVRFAQSKINIDVTRKTVTWSEGEGLNTSLTASRKFSDAILHEYYSMNQLTDINKLPLFEMYETANSIGQLGFFDGTFSDKEQSLKEKLGVIANVARGIISFTGQGYEFFRDEQRLPVAQFDSRNISIDSNDEVSFKGATQRSNDGVRVQYKNPETNKAEYIYFVVNGASVSECVWTGSTYVPAIPLTPLEIELTGCYNRPQAVDRAQLEAKKIIYIQKALKITTLRDGDSVSRGQVVKYADYYEEDVASGEIKSSVNDLHESYSKIKVPTGSYHVTYTDQYGAVHGPIACEVISDYMFMASLPDSYVANGYEIQCGSRFVISDMQIHETNLYEITDKQANSDGTVDLEMIQYSENVY